MTLSRRSRIARPLPRLAVAAALAAAAWGMARTARAEVAEGVPPSQKRVQIRLEHGSANLSDAEVRAALAGAIRSWNAALPADMQLVETPTGAPYPDGEVVFMVRFDADASHFGGKGVDEIADTRPLVDRAQNHAVTAVFLYDHAGLLSTDGKPGTRDLELVLDHELGHALGVEHVDLATVVPPIMAPALDDNGKLLAAGRTLASLHQLTQDDREMLGVAVAKRKARDFTGSFSGTLKVTKLLSGAADSMSGRALPVRDGELIIKAENGKVVLDYKGSRRELPAVDLLKPQIKLEFPDAADGRALRKLTISRGENPGEFDIVATVQPLRATYEVTGTLTRK